MHGNCWTNQRPRKAGIQHRVTKSEQCWKFSLVRQSEADNFAGGPGTFYWFFFNFKLMIWDSRHEDLQLFDWVSNTESELDLGSDIMNAHPSQRIKHRSLVVWEGPTDRPSLLCKITKKNRCRSDKTVILNVLTAIHQVWDQSPNWFVQKGYWKRVFPRECYGNPL